MIDLPRLIILILATWRLTSLVLREDGPWKLFVHLRTILGRTDVGIGALSCFWCLSVWIGTLLSLLSLWGYGHLVMLPLALSAAAIGMEKVTHE